MGVIKSSKVLLLTVSADPISLKSGSCDRTAHVVAVEVNRVSDSCIRCTRGLQYDEVRARHGTYNYST